MAIGTSMIQCHQCLQVKNHNNNKNSGIAFPTKYQAKDIQEGNEVLNEKKEVSQTCESGRLS
jgi:hypothetical protein